MVRRAFLGMGGAAALSHSLGAFAAPAQSSGGSASSLQVDKNVVYGKGGDADLHCDIYHPPAGSEKRMALLHFHGGGWARGSKDTLAGKVTPITARGYVSVAVQYRLSGVAKWPAQNEDVRTAIRWARAHAGMLGVDPARIAVVGYSAGGHLALYAASQPDNELAACVAFYPAAEIADNSLGLLPAGADAAALRAASPINLVKAGWPSTVIYHGLSDVTIPPESSQRLLEKLRGAGVASELHTFAGVPHEFDTHPEFAEACASLTDFFLDRYVLHPRTYPPFGPGGPPGGARG